VIASAKNDEDSAAALLQVLKVAYAAASQAESVQNLHHIAYGRGANDDRG
jgi:hypothetical protein